MGKPKRISTPEEYEKAKKNILKAFKAGLPQRRMEAKFRYTRSDIKKIKATLISEGAITDDEIKAALAQYLKENPNAQGLNKTKVRKKKAIKGKHNETLEKRERILALVKQKLSKTQIARKMQLSLTGVSWHINELIKEGKLKEDEVEKEGSQADEELLDKNSPEYIEKRRQVVEFLKKGFKYHFIRKELDITAFDFDIYIRDIRESKIMTSEQIKEAREKKRQEDLQFVAESVNNGLSITQMQELKPEFTANEVTPMIKELISKGVITQKQVDENRKNGNRRTINKGLKMSPDEQVEFILEKVRKGYSPEEIVKSDKTKSLSLHKVLYQKRQLIAKGAITQEEADKAMRERQEKLIKRKRKRVMKKMKEYAELGYTIQEMAELIKEYSRSELSEIKKEFADELGWYTKEELEEFARLRKQREYDNLPEEEKRKIEAEKLAKAEQIENEKIQRQKEALDRRQAKKDETIKIQLEAAEILKEHLKKGKTMKRAAKLMKVSLEYTYKIRKISIENGRWLTDEELKEIEKKKKQKQERARKAREKKRAQRKAEEKKRRQEEVLARRQAGKDETKKRYITDAEKLKPYIKDGKTMREAAKLNGFKEQYAYIIRRTSIENDAWLTEEELKEIEEKKKQKLEKVRQKKKAQKEKAKKQRAEEQKKAREKKKAEEQKKKQEELLAKRQAKAEATRKKREADIEKLKPHIKEGKTRAEAARLSGLNYQYANSIIKEAIKNGTWLTDEEIKEIEEKKKQKLEEARQEKEAQKEKDKKKKAEEQQRKKEEEQLRIKKEIWKMREYVEQGYTSVEEIAKKMNYSTSYIRRLRKLAIAENIWFSEEAIEEFKKARQIREQKELEKARKEEEERLRREAKEAERKAKEAAQLEQAMAKEKRRKIRGYERTYVAYRREARKEDKLELDGEEDVPVDGRIKFIEILSKLQAAEADIREKDIEIVLNAFELHPEIATKSGIKFLITDAGKKRGVKGAEKMVIELTGILRHTKYYEPLTEYRRWMKKFALLPQIREMKAQNMSNTDIGQRLGISSAEVSIIFNGDKKLDFFDGDNR